MRFLDTAFCQPNSETRFREETHKPAFTQGKQNDNCTHQGQKSGLCLLSRSSFAHQAPTQPLHKACDGCTQPYQGRSRDDRDPRKPLVPPDPWTPMAPCSPNMAPFTQTTELSGSCLVPQPKGMELSHCSPSLEA